MCRPRGLYQAMYVTYHSALSLASMPLDSSDTSRAPGPRPSIRIPGTTRQDDIYPAAVKRLEPLVLLSARQHRSALQKVRLLSLPCSARPRSRSSTSTTEIVSVRAHRRNLPSPPRSAAPAGEARGWRGWTSQRHQAQPGSEFAGMAGLPHPSATSDVWPFVVGMMSLRSETMDRLGKSEPCSRCTAEPAPVLSFLGAS